MLYLTDPSGAYVRYNAIAIGGDANTANEFLEKNYNENITIDDAKMLAISTIQNVNEDKNQVDNIKMLQIKSESSEFEFIDDENIKKIAKHAKIKYTLIKNKLSVQYLEILI